jgi:hypothetical protein
MFSVSAFRSFSIPFLFGFSPKTFHVLSVNRQDTFRRFKFGARVNGSRASQTLAPQIAILSRASRRVLFTFIQIAAVGQFYASTDGRTDWHCASGSVLTFLPFSDETLTFFPFNMNVTLKM